MSHHTSPSGRLRPWEPDSVPAWKQSTAFDRVQAGPALTGLSVLSPEFVFSLWKNSTELEGISMQGTEQTSKGDNCIQHFVCLCSKLWKPNYYLIFRWSPPFLSSYVANSFCLLFECLQPVPQGFSQTGSLYVSVFSSLTHFTSSSPWLWSSVSI